MPAPISPTKARPARAHAARALGVVAAVTAAVGVAAWYGCSIYNPSLLVAAEEEGGPESGPPPVDAGLDGNHFEAASGPCAPALPPARHAEDDPSDAGSQTFVTALHTLDVGIRLDGGPAPLFGYDLDDASTCCDHGPESCTAAVAGATHCDEDGGRDNSGGQLIDGFAAAAGGQFTSATISERLQAGVYSLLIQISDYNGTANDTKVVAALYASDGIEAVGDAAPPPAQWNGSDVWTVDSSFALPGTPIVPTHFDSDAYVSGGVLVMSVDFPISLGTSDTGIFTLDITGGVITANVVSAGDGTYHLENGQIAGRWSASSVLAALESLTFLGTGSPICRDSGTYAALKPQICTAADIATNPSLDNTGVVCDALSVAFGFTADPALIGDIVTGAAKLPLCDDGDAGPDNCPPP